MSLGAAIALLVLTKTVLASHQPDSNVTLLTTKNFHHLVTNENIWVVNFYSSKTKKNQYFAKEFISAAGILKGIVKFGAIDIRDDAELAKNFTVNIKYLPIVKFYGIASNKNPKEYSGPKAARDLVESVLTSILEKIRKRFGTKSSEDFIEEVTDENFDRTITHSKEPWLVLFHAPWCVHCKEIKPIWLLVASNLQKKIKCASIDATVNKIKAEEYDIKAYPTIKLLPFEKKSPTHSFDYTQERTVDSIVDWALDKLPGPNIVQVTNTDVFEKHCLTQNLCVIVALPTIFDCQVVCRKNYLNVVKQLGEKFKRNGWGWVWTEAGVQENLEKVLDIGGFGYPALAVLNPVKMKYSVFKGAFTKSKIEEFLINLAKASAIGVEEDIVGKILVVEPWDGDDGEAFSLNEERFGTKIEL